ncbi:MAG: hypothetical protein INH43_18895 [Acidobacteriaceae bacterium]|nr:hypothetical protein [Acidobacteriaceae bacterium]
MSTLTEQIQAAQPAAAPEQPKRSLLDDITDATLKSRADQLRIDAFEAGRRAQALGIPAPQIELKYMYGRDYGFNEAQSLQFIHLIPQGGMLIPALHYKGRAVLLRRGGYNWKAVEHTEKASEYAFYFMGEAMTDEHGKPLRIRYTLDDATRSGLVARSRGKDNKPGTYDQFGHEMLFARMLSRFHAFHASEVGGGAAVDTSDSLIQSVVEETESRIGAATALADKLAEIKGGAE